MLILDDCMYSGSTSKSNSNPKDQRSSTIDCDKDILWQQARIHCSVNNIRVDKNYCMYC